MKQKEKSGKKPTQPVVSPAGVRADRLRPGNIPMPGRDSVEEERRWQEEHIQ